MKIRSGYVSNSSSSSFVLVGRVLGGFDEIKSLDFSGDKKYVILGKYLCDGQDIIELNETLYNQICVNAIHFGDEYNNIGKVVEVFQTFDQSSFKVSELKKDLPEEALFIFTEKDYHSCNDIKSILQRYVNY